MNSSAKWVSLILRLYLEIACSSSIWFMHIFSVEVSSQVEWLLPCGHYGLLNILHMQRLNIQKTWNKWPSILGIPFHGTYMLQFLDMRYSDKDVSKNDEATTTVVHDVMKVHYSFHSFFCLFTFFLTSLLFLLFLVFTFVA